MFKYLVKRRLATSSSHGLNIVTEEQLESIFKKTIKSGKLQTPAWQYIFDINRCLNSFEINKPKRVWHFLSQLGALTEGMTNHSKLYRQNLMRIEGIEQFTYFSERVQDRRIVVGSFSTERLGSFLIDGCHYQGRNVLERYYPISEAGCWWQLNGMNNIADYYDSGVTIVSNNLLSKLKLPSATIEHLTLAQQYYERASVHIRF